MASVNFVTEAMTYYLDVLRLFLNSLEAHVEALNRMGQCSH